MTLRLVCSGTMGPDLGESLRMPLAWIGSSMRNELSDEFETLLAIPWPQRDADWTARMQLARRMKALCDALEVHCTREEQNG